MSLQPLKSCWQWIAEGLVRFLQWCGSCKLSILQWTVPYTLSHKEEKTRGKNQEVGEGLWGKSGRS